MISLPMLNNANLVPALLLGYLAFCVLYLGGASLQLRPPLLLRPGPIEAAIPFMGWSIWVYLSQFLLLPAAIVNARPDADRSRVFYAMLLATAVAALIFIAFPTELERPQPGLSGLTGLAWTLLHAVDTQFNCFPSLHVALAVLAGIALWRRGWHVSALAWPGLIALSTLTTRQHVALDIAGGLVLAIVAWLLVPKLVRHE